MSNRVVIAEARVVDQPGERLPIPERARVRRYYVRVAEKTIWAGRPDELVQYRPQPEDWPPSIEPPRPISVTFIPATVFNDPILLRANPEYYAWLLSLPTLGRERLLGGNLKIRPAAGFYFKREWCAIVDEVPADLDVVRYWDLAATEKTERNASRSRARRLHRDAGPGEWRQADALWTVQLAMPRRQCEGPAGLLERSSRGFPRVKRRGEADGDGALALVRQTEHLVTENRMAVEVIGPSHTSAARRMSALAGSDGSSVFRAVSAPQTGSVATSMSPSCASTEAWSQ
jgi:hypothetical protein